MKKTILLCFVLALTTWVDAADFSVKPDCEFAFAGQTCIYLLSIQEEVESTDLEESRPFTVKATVHDQYATVNIEPDSSLLYGKVVEVVVQIDPNIDPEVVQAIELSVSATRGSEVHRYESTIQVLSNWMDLERQALQVRDQFLPWVYENLLDEDGNPILDENLTWRMSEHRTSLVVNHYRFFNEVWDLTISWHVTIPPNNWALLYLRKRYQSLDADYIFKKDSWTDDDIQPYRVLP